MGMLLVVRNVFIIVFVAKFEGGGNFDENKDTRVYQYFWTCINGSG